MRRFKSLLLVLPMALMLSTCAAPAYAFSDEDAETSVETPAPSETPAQPLTPEGNMALVDDIEGEAAEDKQFIVVQSRGGHYFYIIIDNASEGENTVHFLNQVDEADLLSIIEEEEQAPAVAAVPKNASLARSTPPVRFAPSTWASAPGRSRSR